jgi:hypothetical protein
MRATPQPSAKEKVVKQKAMHALFNFRQACLLQPLEIRSAPLS